MVNNSSSSTGHICQEPPCSILLGLVLGVLSFLTIAMNILVLYAVKTERTLHTVGNLYIVSLSVADLIVGAIVMPLNIVYWLDSKWRLGIVVCQFWLSMDYVASTASIFSLFILCLDRYRSVSQPLKYLRYRTHARATYMILAAWLFSVMWIIPILGWHVFANGGMRKVSEDQCETEFHCNKLFKVLIPVFNFYLPSLLMIWFYAKIYLTVKEHCKRRELVKETFRCSPGKSILHSNGKGPMHAVMIQSKNVAKDDSRNLRGDDEDYTADDFDSEDDDGDWKNYSYSCVTPIKNKTENSQMYFERTDAAHSQNAFRENGSSGSLPLPGKVKHFPLDICKQQTHFALKGKTESRLDCDLSLQDISVVSETPENVNSHDCRAESSKSDSLYRCDKAAHWSEAANQKRKAAGFNPFKESWQKFYSNSKQRAQALSSIKEKKAAKQLGCIMMAFMVCWIPYFVTFMVIALDASCSDKLRTIHMITIWLGYFNSTLNPFIYPLCNENFKKTFKSILHIHS
ncbi:histamine H1 receptor-like [Protopterus annectens]|uniref:histamine H1 receptor-like n=1 Tax=Protopterus annectens TaxID=7888 RepID=UPI001CFC041C|nr:histamine H1 receptor-like [Protopterus annectens]XP_043933986.1 histamine H1 receptor-like [Protopterus annectens]XP_043933987.1 histamine H1 receptor-like [Protopterus annectens]XP_043933988.1 histamine H1 receptor-like [Protopterus annectens]